MTWARSIADRPLWRSLRLRLMLLVLLASLPSLGLLLITANQERSEALVTGRDDASRIARLISADQQAVSSQIASVLNTLSLNSELLDTDPESCTRLLSSVLDQSSQSPANGVVSSDVQVAGASFRHLGLLSAAGETSCLVGGETTSLSADEIAVGEAAIDSGRVVTGNLVPTTTGALGAIYAVPVTLANGSPGGALVAQMEISALGSFAIAADLPSETLVAIFDREGRLQQQYSAAESTPSPPSPVGTPSVSDVIGEQGIPLVEESDIVIGGKPFVYAIDTSWYPGTDGSPRISYVMVAIPEATVVQRATEKFNENLGKLAIAGLVGLVAAWVGADLLGGRDTGTRLTLIRDYYHIYETGQISKLEQIVGQGYVDRSHAAGSQLGIEELRQNVAAFRVAFPDGKIEILDLVADHDTVMARVKLTGTQVADYFEIPPGHQPVEADGVETFRFAHGMVVESWSLFGALYPRDAELPLLPSSDEVQRPGLLRRVFRWRPWGGGTT